MKHSQNINVTGSRLRSPRMNWLFEIEPYSRSENVTFQDLRDGLRLKKALQKAVQRDLAPISLIESIRAGIRM